MRADAPAHRLSVAPMMDWTDRHFRFFVRQLTSRTLLYTEMVNMNAIIHGDRERHLQFSPEERPLALQVGGDDPSLLAECAQVAQAWGYDEVNLNVGCPSERVQNGNFGACLMAEPERVYECVSAMREAVSIPVTVKHRIGIDELDSYADMARFVDVVARSGVRRFIVHARKAWLKGLSPRENREIPPLRYADVYRLKRDFPFLEIELNGGVRSLAEAGTHLRHTDGVMIGRAAYENPYLLAEADQQLYGAVATAPSRREVVEALLPYVQVQLTAGTRLNRISRHVLGLFNGQPGAKSWRRHLSLHAHAPGADERVIREASELISDEVLDARPLDGAGCARPGFPAPSAATPVSQPRSLG